MAEDCTSQIIEDIKYILFDDRNFESSFKFITWIGNGNSFVVRDDDDREYRVVVIREK